MGSLHMWAKEDKPRLYKSIMIDNAIRRDIYSTKENLIKSAINKLTPAHTAKLVNSLRKRPCLRW